MRLRITANSVTFAYGYCQCWDRYAARPPSLPLPLPLPLPPSLDETIDSGHVWQRACLLLSLHDCGAILSHFLAHLFGFCPSSPMLIPRAIAGPHPRGLCCCCSGKHSPSLALFSFLSLASLRCIALQPFATRQKFYDKLRMGIVNREKDVHNRSSSSSNSNNNNNATVQRITLDDVQYLTEEIWRGRSSCDFASGADLSLTLAREGRCARTSAAVGGLKLGIRLVILCWRQLWPLHSLLRGCSSLG